MEEVRKRLKEESIFMQLDLSRFSPVERSTLQLRVLYEGAGYRKFRCSHFEEYSLYQQNERFLSDSQVITFTDLDGKLRAIKPDVTLSIAKNAQPAAGECKKYYYTEQICRPSRESHTFSEISQMGLECIGAVGAAACIAVGTGMISSMTEVKKLIPAKITYHPNKANKAVYDRNFEVFKNLYKCNKKNFEILNG